MNSQEINNSKRRKIRYLWSNNLRKKGRKTITFYEKSAKNLHFFSKKGPKKCINDIKKILKRQNRVKKREIIFKRTKIYKNKKEQKEPQMEFEI